MSDLLLSAIREANRTREPLFKNALGVPYHTADDGSDWSIAEWTNAMAGEAGEACNFSKKLKRGDFSNSEEGLDLLMEEIADVVLYADLVAWRVGRNLSDAIRDKFNKVSDRIGCDIKL